MIPANDQLADETSYTHLAKVLRSGGALEVGENYSLVAFARLRFRNRTVVVDAEYRDLAAVLKEMDAKARDHFVQDL
jgi:hypothetical protein